MIHSYILILSQTYFTQNIEKLKEKRVVKVFWKIEAYKGTKKIHMAVLQLFVQMSKQAKVKNNN